MCDSRTAYQVENNLESQKLQYAMEAHLRALGWSCVEIVDEDLGRSAGGTVTRTGFERSVAHPSAPLLYSHPSYPGIGPTRDAAETVPQRPRRLARAPPDHVLSFNEAGSIFSIPIPPPGVLSRLTV